MQLAVFLVVAAVAVGSALGLVLKRNPIHGALFLIVNLGSIAVLFLTLQAQFLAWAQVIIYAGAIMILFVFAIMVLIPGKEETGPDPLRPVRLVAIPFGVLLLIELVLMLLARPAGPVAGTPTAGGVEAIGRLLFTDYLFPFELTSVLLLAAMIGVLALAKGTAVRGAAAGEPSRRTREGAGAPVRGAAAGEPSRRTPDGAGAPVRGAAAGEPSRRTREGAGAPVRGAARGSSVAAAVEVGREATPEVTFEPSGPGESVGEPVARRRPR